MSFTIEDEVNQKIELKHKELTRGRIKKQLGRNGYGKYTSVETEMIVSKAFWSLSGSCKNLLMLFLLKRRLKFQKGKVPVCINSDEITMTWKELQSPPFDFHPEQIRRNLKTLLSRGFIKTMHKGGAYKKDRSIYGISENWRLWDFTKDFSGQRKAVKRGYQGRGFKEITTHGNVSHTRTQKCEPYGAKIDSHSVSHIKAGKVAITKG